MKITIEATGIFTEVQGIRCRVWRGVTEFGISCDLAVPLLRVKFEADRAEFEDELLTVPAQSQVLSFRDVW